MSDTEVEAEDVTLNNIANVSSLTKNKDKQTKIITVHGKYCDINV